MSRHHHQHRAPSGTAAHLHGRFHVVTAITNPRRWRSRYERYNDFRAHIEASGATLWTVECAYGHRAHAITDAGQSRHIQLRTGHELWHKENLLNIAIARLPSDWAYVAWIDADVRFVRPDWLNETVQMLQHHPVVQMFGEAHDLGPDYQVIGRHEAFAKSYALNRPQQAFGGYYGPRAGMNWWHPGFAWAARRDALDCLGGLIDIAALGAGDNHMAHALIGQVERSIHPRATHGYRRWLHRWQQRAERHIRRDIGFVEGTLLHDWHGRKADRRYWDRWRILVENRFDPFLDLKRDTQNVWQLVDHGTDRSIRLRDQLRAYNAGRNEDSIDL